MMPVTIGTLTSNVNVADANSMLTDDVLEQIVRLVMARLKEERYNEAQARREREIRDRMSEAEPFWS